MYHWTKSNAGFPTTTLAEENIPSLRNLGNFNKRNQTSSLQKPYVGVIAKYLHAWKNGITYWEPEINLPIMQLAD